MNNYRNNRKNRFKSNNDRGFRKRSMIGQKNQNDYGSNLDFRYRSHGRNNHNASKLVEKYTNLAREALSSGDKILSENYLQHADHFSRVIDAQESKKVTNGNDNVIEQNFKKEINDLVKEKKSDVNSNIENNKID